jgi:V8-like Glu-specific endopeptidase
MEIISLLHGVLAHLTPGIYPAGTDAFLPGENAGHVTVQDVIGTDDRVTFYDPKYPWRLVGQLIWDKGTMGTAVMIGKRLALTCFHCVDFSSPCYFVPAKNNAAPATNPKEPYGRFKVVDACYLNITKRPAVGTNEYGSLDYAIVKLDGEPNIGYAGYKLYDDAWLKKKMWYCVGYPGNWSGQPSFQKNIEIMRTEMYIGTNPDGAGWEGLKFFTDADSVGGQSGSPLFQIIDKIVYISGIIAQSGSADNGAAGCNRFVFDLITWARNNMDKP